MNINRLVHFGMFSYLVSELNLLRV